MLTQSTSPMSATVPTQLRCLACKLRKVKCSGPPEPCHHCRRLCLECTFSDSGPGRVAPTANLTEAGTARRRTVSACDECHAQKAKCSGRRPCCHRCEKRALHCTYHERSASRRSLSSRASLGPPSWSPPDSSASSASASASCASAALPGRRLLPLPLPRINVAADKSLLRRDIVARHIDAYFDHVYPLQGYDFLHRPTVLEDFHNDRIPPVLCTAICATAAMFISPSDKDSRAVSVRWSEEVDRYILCNMNRLEVLHLRLMILSMFQHFAYRQFGRVWQMHGSAVRLALAFQLNEDPSLGPGKPARSSIEQECRRRLMWGLFVWDKLLSAGIDEFVALPDAWMRLPLPCNEYCFQHELPQQTGVLSDGVDALSQRDLGCKGFLLLLQTIRHRVLKTTKSFLMRGDALKTLAQKKDAISNVVGLRRELTAFYESIPAHLKLTDRNIFSHSNTPDFTPFLTLHTWFFLCISDLFRICLPGPVRESAPRSLLAAAPGDFVPEWQSLAISFALTLAQTWRHLQELRRAGRLPLLRHLPMLPAHTVIIHQCTKILLLARRFGLYSRLIDPLTGEAVALGDELVEQLCRSNVAYLDEMAAIAPISAVVQHDVRDMLERELRGGRGSGRARELELESESENRSPVANEVQRKNILSRYHPLSMGLAATVESEDTTDEKELESPHKPPTPAWQQQQRQQQEQEQEPESGKQEEAPPTPRGAEQVLPPPPPVASQEPYLLIPHSLFQPFPIANSVLPMAVADIQTSFASQQAEGPVTQLTGGGGPGPGGAGVRPVFWANDGGGFMPEYTVAPSQYDMGGELDWFMMSPYLVNQDGEVTGVAASQVFGPDTRMGYQ